MSPVNGLLVEKRIKTYIITGVINNATCPGVDDPKSIKATSYGAALDKASNTPLGVKTTFTVFLKVDGGGRLVFT